MYGVYGSVGAVSLTSSSPPQTINAMPKPNQSSNSKRAGTTGEKQAREEMWVGCIGGGPGLVVEPHADCLSIFADEEDEARRRKPEKEAG